MIMLLFFRLIVDALKSLIGIQTRTITEMSKYKIKEQLQRNYGTNERHDLEHAAAEVLMT